MDFGIFFDRAKTVAHIYVYIWYVNQPALLAADTVDRFGLSRFSSEISFESAGDNKSVIEASLEITLFSSVEELCSVALLGRRVDNADADVDVGLIGVAEDDIDWYGDRVERMVDENGDWVVRRVVDGRFVVVVVIVVVFIIVAVGFAECVFCKTKKHSFTYMIRAYGTLYIRSDNYKTKTQKNVELLKRMAWFVCIYGLL